MKRKRKPRRKLKGSRGKPSLSPKRVTDRGKRIGSVEELKYGFCLGRNWRKSAIIAALMGVQKWVWLLMWKRI